MRALVWKFKRLQVMSLREIVFRIGRFLSIEIESFRLGRGWVPRPKVDVRPQKSLYSEDVAAITRAWEACFGEFDSQAYKKLTEEIPVFHNYRIEINDSLDWHVDPDTHIRSPMDMGKKIDYRDSSKNGNCKTLWEASRHKHLVSLGVAYAITGDDVYLRAVKTQLTSWIEQNPFGYGIHWCSSLEAALRVIAWSILHGLITLRNNDGLLGLVEDKESIKLALYQHAYFIANYLSRYSSANNHLIGELSGLWVCCKVFDLGPEGAAWARSVKRELEDEAKKQIFDDGGSKEQANYYHMWVNEYLLLDWLIGQRYSDHFSDKFEEKIFKMSRFITDMRAQGGQLPQIGDSDDGVVVQFGHKESDDPYRDIESTISQYVGESENKNKARMTDKAFWYSRIFVGLPDQVGRLADIVNASDTGVLKYEDSGYVILKGEGIDLVFDAGSLGYPEIAAHGHADALSICLALDGQWWLVDPGTYSYHTEAKWRNYFRGTSAHNTVTNGTMDQSQIGGAFLWLKRGKSEITHIEEMTSAGMAAFGGMVLGYSRDRSRHTRDIVYDGTNNAIHISDRLSANANQQFSIHFHFHPEVELSLISSGNQCVLTRTGTDRQITLGLDASISWSVHMGETDPLLGWYSDTLGVKVPCSVLVGTAMYDNEITCETELTWQ